MGGIVRMNMYVAEQLLKIGAVSLKPQEPFTWSSGIKSPIYCDNRLTLSYPKVRQKIALGLTNLIKENFSDVDVIAGTATAGIPHAAWVSDKLQLPMCYVRGKAKSHGKGNQIEGGIKPGQKVVVVEDLISTGGSSLTAVQALEEYGCEVLGVVSIFTYELRKAVEQFREANITARSLSDYTSLIHVAVQKNKISEEDVDRLLSWRRDPESWLR
jgi:orotate phosphoribosyltransferase